MRTPLGATWLGRGFLAFSGALGSVLLAAAPAGALPLISEVLYDAVGSDTGQSFVELYGTPGTDLTGLFVEGINGSNGSVTDSVALSGLIPADGFFVVADDQGDGTTLVAEADLIASFDFQNGPDSVVLRSASAPVDALGYGDFAPGDVFAGEGAPAPDPPAGSSLARRFANVDSDDNLADFVVLAAPTPGTGPLAPVPEPGSAVLFAGGLAGIAAASRRRALLRALPLCGDVDPAPSSGKVSKRKSRTARSCGWRSSGRPAPSASARASSSRPAMHRA